MARALLVLLSFTLILTSTGCSSVFLGEKPSRDALLSVQPGITKKGEVLHRFGRAGAPECGRYLVYEMERRTVTGWASKYGYYAQISNYEPHRLLFEFDTTGVLTHWSLEAASGLCSLAPNLKAQRGINRQDTAQ